MVPWMKLTILFHSDIDKIYQNHLTDEGGDSSDAAVSEYNVRLVGTSVSIC